MGYRNRHMEDRDRICSMEGDIEVLRKEEEE